MEPNGTPRQDTGRGREGIRELSGMSVNAGRSKCPYWRALSTFYWHEGVVNEGDTGEPSILKTTFARQQARQPRDNCRARKHCHRNHVGHTSWEFHKGNKVGFHLLSHGPDTVGSHASGSCSSFFVDSKRTVPVFPYRSLPKRPTPTKTDIA